MVVLFLGFDGFDDDAIRQPGVFFWVDGQSSWSQNGTALSMTA
jgi:hypothetical protein